MIVSRLTFPCMQFWYSVRMQPDPAATKARPSRASGARASTPPPVQADNDCLDIDQVSSSKYIAVVCVRESFYSPPYLQDLLDSARASIAMSD